MTPSPLPLPPLPQVRTHSGARVHLHPARDGRFERTVEITGTPEQAQVWVGGWGGVHHVEDREGWLTMPR